MRVLTKSIQIKLLLLPLYSSERNESKLCMTEIAKNAKGYYITFICVKFSFMAPEQMQLASEQLQILCNIFTPAPHMCAPPVFCEGSKKKVAKFCPLNMAVMHRAPPDFSTLLRPCS